MAADVMNALTYEFKTRETLARECGISDRELRREIRRLKLEGEMIFSSSGTKGYKKATPREMLRVKHEAQARMNKEAELIKRIDEVLKDIDQTELYELDGQLSMPI